MQPFTSVFPLKVSRTHEVHGPGAYLFAVALIARRQGSTAWVCETWDKQQINPTGVSTFTDPSGIMLCNTQNQAETLAVAEECLRSGAVPLTVFLPRKPLGLTEGRRLQLAAREGKSTGLAIIPEGMGSNAAETRWHCQPVFDANARYGDTTLQHWKLTKNKSGTTGRWYVRWDPVTQRITPASLPDN